MTTMTTLTADDLKSILAFTVQLARKAGTVILQGSDAIQNAPTPDEGASVAEKKNSVDLVTEYDVKVEELVKKALREKYPSFGLYARLSPGNLSLTHVASERNLILAVPVLP